MSTPPPACSPAQLAAVKALVGEDSVAGRICAKYAVGPGPGGAQAAVLQYLAQRTVASDAHGTTYYLLISSFLVFLMQAGFAMLCAGHIRVKSNRNILLKNMLDCAIGTFSWFLLGNALAFGEGPQGQTNPFIGSGDFALANTTDKTVGDDSWALFLFHWAFSAAAATITAGAVAERVTLGVYFGYTFLMTSFVYPVVVHWIWTTPGWLSPNNPNPLFGTGAIDFAGGIVVHTVGGMAALIGTYFTGPRAGRFGINGEVNKDFRDNNGNLVVLGTFLLWFGWYGFNPGSAAVVSTPQTPAIVARTAVTTTLSAGVGGISCMLLKFAFARQWDVMQLCNGVLCGLVAVTPGCGVIDPWAGMLVGLLGSATFLGLDHLMLRALLDDVVAATPMHLGCGVVGTLFVGLFAREGYVQDFYSPNPVAGRRWGAFFGGDGRLLAAQIVALLVTMLWVALFFIPYFALMRHLNVARVPIEQELAGLDASKYSLMTTNELPTAHKPKQKMYV